MTVRGPLTARVQECISEHKRRPTGQTPGPLPSNLSASAVCSKTNLGMVKSCNSLSSVFPSRALNRLASVAQSVKLNSTVQIVGDLSLINELDIFGFCQCWYSCVNSGEGTACFTRGNHPSWR